MCACGVLESCTACALYGILQYVDVCMCVYVRACTKLIYRQIYMLNVCANLCVSSEFSQLWQRWCRRLFSGPRTVCKCGFTLSNVEQYVCEVRANQKCRALERVCVNEFVRVNRERSAFSSVLRAHTCIIVHARSHNNSKNKQATTVK